MSRETQHIGSLADGRYLLESILGQGGMAVVYAAWDTRLEVRRAVKILNPNLADKQNIRERFEREARVMARLHHPNIVMVHDVGIDGNKPYIIMEMLKGGCLADLIAPNQGMDPARALVYIRQVLEALRFAHDEGVIHRDIKPENILLDKRKQAKVTDFGIARLEQSDHALTRTGAVLGTWAYMAPEVRTDGKSSGTASDIYAVGAMLFACVTGRPPFDLYASNLRDVHFQGVPLPLHGVIQQATCYQPDHRFSSAQDMAQAVQAAEIAIEATTASADQTTRPAALSTMAPLPPAPAANLSTETFALFDEPAEPTPALPPPAPMESEPVEPTPTLTPPSEPGVNETMPDQVDDPPPQGDPPVAGTLSDDTVAWSGQPSRRRPVILAATAAAVILLALGGLWGLRDEPAGSAPTPDVTTPGAAPEDAKPTVPVEPAAPIAEPEPAASTVTASEPSPSDEPTPAPPVVAPHPEPRQPTPAPADGPAVQAEPAEEPAVEPPPAATAEPEASIDIVSFSILSDPLGGQVRVGDQVASTPGKLELPVGVHSFAYQHDEWSTSCEIHIDPQVARLKFTNGKQGCTLIH